MMRRILDDATAFQAHRCADCEVAGSLAVFDDSLAEGASVLSRAMAEKLVPREVVADLADTIAREMWQSLKRTRAQERFEGHIVDAVSSNEVPELSKQRGSIRHLAALATQQAVAYACVLVVSTLRREEGRYAKLHTKHTAAARKRPLESMMARQKMLALADDASAKEWLQTMGVTDWKVDAQRLGGTNTDAGNTLNLAIGSLVRDPRDPPAAASRDPRRLKKSTAERTEPPAVEIAEPDRDPLEAPECTEPARTSTGPTELESQSEVSDPPTKTDDAPSTPDVTGPWRQSQTSSTARARSHVDFSQFLEKDLGVRK